MAMIPADRRLDIQAGDKLRWDTDDEGTISVGIVKQRYEVLNDFELVSMVGGRSQTHEGVTMAIPRFPSTADGSRSHRYGRSHRCGRYR